MRQRSLARTAFTLVELLVVIAIIGVLMQINGTGSFGYGQPNVELNTFCISA